MHYYLLCFWGPWPQLIIQLLCLFSSSAKIYKYTCLALTALLNCVREAWVSFATEENNSFTCVTMTTLLRTRTHSTEQKSKYIYPGLTGTSSSCYWWNTVQFYCIVGLWFELWLWGCRLFHYGICYIWLIYKVTTNSCSKNCN